MKETVTLYFIRFWVIKLCFICENLAYNIIYKQSYQLGLCNISIFMINLSSQYAKIDLITETNKIFSEIKKNTKMVDYHNLNFHYYYLQKQL